MNVAYRTIIVAGMLVFLAVAGLAEDLISIEHLGTLSEDYNVPHTWDDFVFTDDGRLAFSGRYFAQMEQLNNPFVLDLDTGAVRTIDAAELLDDPDREHLPQGVFRLVNGPGIVVSGASRFPASGWWIVLSESELDIYFDLDEVPSFEIDSERERSADGAEIRLYPLSYGYALRFTTTGHEATLRVSAEIVEPAGEPVVDFDEIVPETQWTQGYRASTSPDGTWIAMVGSRISEGSAIELFRVSYDPSLTETGSPPEEGEEPEPTEVMSTSDREERTAETGSQYGLPDRDEGMEELIPIIVGGGILVLLVVIVVVARRKRKSRSG